MTGAGGGAEAILLRDQHGQYLLPAARQGAERLGVGVPQRAHRRADRRGEVGQERRVQRVGLGQLPGGAGEVPHLTGVDDHHTVSWSPSLDRRVLGLTTNHLRPSASGRA